MTSLINDVKYAMRQLFKNPGFSIVAALTLAIGIGANITVFSVVNTVLLRSLPFKDADRLTLVRQFYKSFNMMTRFSYPDFLALREQSPVFSDLAAYTRVRFDLMEKQETRKIDGAHVSGNFFSMLDVSPVLGRAFTSDDEKRDNGPIVMINHDLWRERFGQSKDVLGQTIIIDNRACSIIGVLPPGFRYPDSIGDAQIWSVLSPAPQDRSSWMDRNNCFLSVVGLLKPAMITETAIPTLNELHKRNGGHPDTEIRLSNLRETVIGDSQTTLWILSFIVGFTLLIVCANVANLCLSRATSREKELAIRQALGANKWRLLRQFTTESILLALLGGFLGLLVTILILSLFRIKIADFIPVSNVIHIEPSVILFCLGLSLLVGGFIGVAPFAFVQRSRHTNVLTERQSTSGRHVGFSHGLVVAQIALALILSMGMGLMMRSMRQLAAAETGFNQDNLVTFKIDMGPRDDPQRRQFCNDYLTRFAAIPVVKGVATDSSMPCSTMSNIGPVYVEGYTLPDESEIMLTSHNVSLDYFKTLQIPIQQGRTISAKEHQSKARVVLINESLAQRFWPNKNPLDRELKFTGKRYRIIGIVPDVVQGNVKGDKPNQAFFPFDATFHGPELSFVVRADCDPGQVIEQARAILANMDAGLALYDVSTFKAQLNQSIIRERFTTTFLTLFASIALVLVVIGLYGVISYAVTQRTREIGIRMALGAQKSRVLVMVLKQGAILLIFGLIIGVLGSLGLTRFLAGILYGVSATDPVTFIDISLLITVVSLLACWIPAWRAAKIDPMEALRYE